MAIYKIPYGRGYQVIKIDDERVVDLVEPKIVSSTTIKSKDIVIESLSNPIKSAELRDISKGKGKVLLITSDHTRPMPSKVTIPILLEEIRAGNKNAEIVILIATGCHRATNRQEMIAKFGTDIVTKEKIINHDSSNISQLVFKGYLPSGNELWLNAYIDWADLIISEGVIEPHFFSGFSGGRKSILPGIAGESTIFQNHCAEFIAHKSSRTGIINNNPVHEDMLIAAEKAKLKFILNVILDKNKNIIHAFAGDYKAAHELGCKVILDKFMCPVSKADIVITSNEGYPLDQNIYQAVKGMTAAESCVNPGGVIIIASFGCDGHGGEDFFNWLSNNSSPQAIWDKIISIKRNETGRDQWQAQILARVLVKSKVIFVTNPNNRYLVENMHMTYANNLQQAFHIAESLMGEKSSVSIIPYGVSTIIGSN